MTAAARIGAALCALAALWLAFTAYMEVSLAGFPDGHVTDYGRAVDVPLRTVSAVALSVGIWCLGLVVAPISSRMRAAGLLIAAVLLVAAALAASLGIPWYFGTHLGLDNGIGG